MLAKNVTMQDLQNALDSVNKKFDGNIKFKDIRQQGKSIRFTLTVKDSRKAGGRLGFPNIQTGKQRHISAACWHAHGEFFDALPPQAVIKSGEMTIRPGDTWQDRNIGSQYHPLYYSEACECCW